jgi:superfamily II DNA or RNA helicase
MTRFATDRQRRALWVASGGACQICGAPLSHDFHADHIRPWSLTGDTNPHDMLALCPPCNTRKGARMLRKHQTEALAIANDIGTGTRVCRVLASVTPGGGKSSLPVIFADALMRRGLIDKTLWVVPRDSLRKQAESAFTDQHFRNLFGHRREIRAAGNEVDPTRGTDGYATTYQAIMADPSWHVDEMRRHRYAVWLDEVHHVADGSAFHRALQPIIDRAAFVGILSGTLSRADNERIAFLDYEELGGRAEVVLRDTPDTAVIRYSRRDALAERAVLPIYFERVDGRASWIDKDGVERQVHSLSGAGEDTSGALYTALRQGYAYELLRETIEHWRDYAAVNPRSKFLVVAPTISLAKDYLKHIRSVGVDDVEIATSEDSEDAKQNIDRLKGKRRPEIKGLVTVGMAYEGLDCPAITHIACLTHIRSHEWIEQMLARATRVDRDAGDWADQRAYVWAPDDDLFTEAVQTIMAEQAPFVVDPVVMDLADKDGKPERDRDAAIIVPLDAETTAIRAEDMQSGKIINADQYRLIREAQTKIGLRHVPPTMLAELIDIVASQEIEEQVQQIANAPQLTHSEKEAALRKQIDRSIKLACRGNGEAIKALNLRLVKDVGKRRDEMTLDELHRAFRFVQSFIGQRKEVGGAAS